MGKGSRYHEEVVKYLEKKYGKIDNKLCELTSFKDKKLGYKTGPFKCDYVIKKNNKKAIVDVVFWEAHNETLGKVISYFYEIIKRNDNYELWIIANFKRIAEKETGKNMKLINKYIVYNRNWFKLLKEMCMKVIASKYKKKLKFYDFTGKGLIKI